MSNSIKSEKRVSVDHPIVRALYDFQAQNEEVELSFKAGDFIVWFGEDETGWAEGEIGGKIAWFPANYVDTSTIKAMKNLKMEKEKKMANQTKQSIAEGQLERFLQRRPSKEELEEKNILPSTQKTKERPGRNTVKGRLKSFMKTRPKKEELMAKNIIHKDFTPPPEMARKKSFLNAFVKGKENKPKVEDKNIPKDELFGISLEDLYSRIQNKTMLPFVEQCVEYLKDKALDEEGLFRVNGSYSEVEQLIKSLSAGNPIPSGSNPHSVASILKKFFRELPEPLIPNAYQSDFAEALLVEDEDLKLATLGELVDALPPLNRLVFDYLMEFLYLVSTHSEKNLMSCRNIGIVFAPTLIRGDSFEKALADSSSHINAEIISLLIQEYNIVFRLYDDE